MLYKIYEPLSGSVLVHLIWRWDLHLTVDAHQIPPESPTADIGSYHIDPHNRKNHLILIMTPEKQDKTLELSKHWSADSTLARNEVIMKMTYPVKSVKCNKICSNY